MQNYNLFFPIPFHMAMYHILHVVIFWVLGRIGVLLSNSYHSGLLKSLLWSELFQDLPLLSQYMWRLLCSQEDFWQRGWSNITGIKLMRLHRCYWLLCLDCSCNLFSFVKVCIPAVPQYTSKILQWALKTQSKGNWTHMRRGLDKQAALFFRSCLFVKKVASMATQHPCGLETFPNNCYWRWKPVSTVSNNQMG